jgi:hypothetical protein
MKFLKTKYLTPIAFLIFFMPFLRNCMGKVESVETAVAIDTTYVDTLKDISNNQKKSPEFGLHKIQNVPKPKIDNNLYENLNGYQLAEFLPSAVFDEEFKIEDLFFAGSFYTYILLLSILMIVFSWRRKFLRVRNLAVANIISLVISIILLVESGAIDEFADIKYGFYVFLMYSLFLVYLSDKESLESKN